MSNVRYEKIKGVDTYEVYRGEELKGYIEYRDREWWTVYDTNMKYLATKTSKKTATNRLIYGSLR
jgi:hypothetical protein